MTTVNGNMIGELIEGNRPFFGVGLSQKRRGIIGMIGTQMSQHLVNVLNVFYANIFVTLFFIGESQCAKQFGKQFPNRLVVS